ncbi:hypothetical protein AKJ16_DCAP21400 [Drosera capensis]
MEYDYHRSRPAPPPYDSRNPNHRNSPPSTAAPHISSFYPRIGQSSGQPVARAPPYHTNAPAASPAPGTGIRVAIKPEYRITPPPQLSPQMVEIPRSNFQFDFDLERKALTELEKEHPNWSRLGLENLPSRSSDSKTSSIPTADPVVMKYIASGLNREAVPAAVANYGDNPAKVREFVNGYNLLREMGFSANNVVEGLLMFDNDTDKVLANFLNNSTS